MTRPFRFGVVAPIQTDLPTWRDRVRRIADSGYSTLLVPDVPQWQPAPGPALAVAAALADLRVGTWVYASPLRPPWMTAWEAHSLSVLTDGRFEMGVGTGRPSSRSSSSIPGRPVPMPISKRPSVSTDSECASHAMFQAGRSGAAYTHVPTRRSARVAATANAGPGAGCHC